MDARLQGMDARALARLAAAPGCWISVSASRALARVDQWQRRHSTVAFAVAVAKKFTADRASNLAALLAYYAFVSLFPLLLVLVSVLGFVLEDDPARAGAGARHGARADPGHRRRPARDVQSLTGSGPALVIGLLGALWAGLGVTLALGRAFDEVWDIPRVDQPNALKARLRGTACSSSSPPRWSPRPPVRGSRSAAASRASERRRRPAVRSPAPRSSSSPPSRC